MSWTAKLLGTITGAGVSKASEGIGNAAIKLRTAITGDLPPEVKEVLIEADKDIALAQTELNKIDGKSTSFFRGGWRPATGWLCVFGLGYSALVSPILEGIVNIYRLSIEGAVAFNMPVTDTETLKVLLVSLLGIGTLRTIEKARKIK